MQKADKNNSDNRTLNNIILAAILLAGLYLQTQAVFHSEVVDPIHADAAKYYMYAYNLNKYGIYSGALEPLVSPEITPKPDSFITPGYPLFLSLFVEEENLKLFLIKVTTTQMLLSLIGLLLLYFTLKIHIPEKYALAAVALTAISPHLVNINIYLLTESLFTFLLILVLFILSRLPQNNNSLLALFGGVVIGCASLTRPSLQYFLIALLPLIWFSFDRKKAIKITVMLIIGFILTFGVWLARNYVVLGQLSDPSLAKKTLAVGIYPDLEYKGMEISKGYPYQIDPRANEIGRDMESVINELKRRFTEEPLRHIRWYLIGKPITFLSWNNLAGNGDTFLYIVSKSPYFQYGVSFGTHRLMYYLHWPIIILALFGSLLAWFMNKSQGYKKSQIFFIRLLSLILIYNIALHMVASPFPRYSIPLRPIIYSLAMFTIMFFFNFRKNRS